MARRVALIALNRLKTATGREQSHSTAQDFKHYYTAVYPRPDLQQQYEQRYAYDELGNLLQLIHLGGASERFRQTFGYARNR